MDSFIPFTHQQPKMLIGSCFSDEIGRILAQNGFDCLCNPGGTLFHPLAIACLLNWALDEPSPLRHFQRHDVFLSWDLSGTFYAMSATAFEQKTNALHQNLRNYLQRSSHLIITFGTSWAYFLPEDQQLVANCHKAPAKTFRKELTEEAVMKVEWLRLVERLAAQNPQQRLIFTVSPVRHIKDGLIENNRSKARLLLLTEHLSTLPNCTYFESYELVIDVLRDHIYFKEDGVHPNQKAINEVWELFQSQMLDQKTQQLLKEWAAIQKSKSHRLLYPESIQAKQLQSELIEKERVFLKKHPFFKDSTPA